MPTLPDHFLAVTDAVNQQLAQIIASQRRQWQPLGPATTELCDAANHLLSGGKRMRAILGAIGYAAMQDVATLWSDALTTPPAITLGAALELYQASALIHDDYIDDAPTRRGQPAAHLTFTKLHRSHAWRGSEQTFGAAGAILLGDLLLSLASQTMANSNSSPTAVAAFDAMTAEVAVGQYLDMRSEMLPLGAGTPQQELASALNVVRHKSARYSVMHPLLIGALSAGLPADSPQLQPLRIYGEEIGIAFQLRDDDLGVFGNSQMTGKPVGDDLREGKRTVLLALTWERADQMQRDQLKKVLGNKAASLGEIDQASRTIISVGARAAHEELITQHLQQGLTALEAAADFLQPTALADLQIIAQLLTSRQS